MIGRYVAPGHAGPRRNGRTARQTLHAIAMIGADARKAVAAPARDSHMARLAVAKTAHRLSGDDAADADPRADGDIGPARQPLRSEEHTSDLQSLMRNSYAVFCLTKKHHQRNTYH